MEENNKIKEPPVELFNKTIERKKAWKYGPYLIVLDKLKEYKWLGLIYHYETREILWGCEDFTLKWIFERCAEWIINKEESND